MKQYLIICEEICPNCDGKIVISNPIYQEMDEYLQTLPEWQEKHIWTDAVLAKINQWFADHGYPGGDRHWPVEEYLCEDCDGTGIYRHEVDFDEIFKDRINLLAECGHLNI